MHDERKSYTPLLVVVGEGRLVPGLETDLKKAAKWYINNAKKAIPQILKTAQDGNF